MPKQVSQRDVSQAVSMISKITTAMFQNISRYKQALEKGDEKSVEKYKKIARQLQDSKVNWEKHMEELLLNLDKNVELAMDESLEENKSKLTESREFVVIDPWGNARPVGSKIQASQYIKKMGGPRKGYYLVLKKNALKARRAIEKNGGNATNTKIQDIMFDLLYENKTMMNKSYLKRIIKEEYEKLITEKFGTGKLQAIKNKIGAWDGKKFFNNLAKKEGIQWENVTDAAIGNAANLNTNILNFMFVGGDLKGVFRGKKFVNEFAKPLESHAKGSLGSQYDKSYRTYYTSYKRVLADADEIVTINLDIAKTESTTVIADRAAQKEGALALKKASDVARENNRRYQELSRQKRDIAGFGQNEVEKLVEQASKVLEDAVSAHLSQLKSGMVPQSNWNTQYQTASRMLSRVMDLFQSYLRAGAEEAKGHEKVLSLDKDASDEKVKEMSWYVDWAVKDAKNHVSDIRTELKNYYLELKKINKAPMRAIGA